MSDPITAKGSDSKFKPHPEGQFVGQCVDTATYERLLSKAIPEPNSGCLLWTAATNAAGYGLIRVAGKSQLAHRIAYAALHGPIPNGCVVLHRCDTPACINADSHLALGTHADNVADKIAKGRGRAGNANATKTACRNGHAFDAINTYIRPGGWRDCRTCRRDAGLRLMQRRAADV